MGELLYYVPPPVVGVLHVNAEHLSCLKALHVNVGSFFFMCCRKRKSLMTLMTNDLNDHPD